MRRLWVLAWKEVTLAFRDVGGIITMLVSPLVLTLVIGAAFSGGSGTPIADIPVLLIDRDQGQFSAALIDIFALDSVQQLVALEIIDDNMAGALAGARARVDADEVAALVVIPDGFSDRVFPMATLVEERLGLDLFSLTPESTLSGAEQLSIAAAYQASQQVTAEPVVIEIYASPDWRLSTSVVKGVIQQGLEIMNIQVQGMSVIVDRLVVDQFAELDQARAAGADVATSPLLGVQSGLSDAGADLSQDLPIEVAIVSKSGRSFDWASYSAVSMAILFLMFAVTSGGRTLLAERRLGTLPRLLTSPMPALFVLVGKMAGIVLTGVLQMILLWGATSLIGAYWGAPFAVLISILFLVICASGVGALLSAWSKTAGQASALGTAVTLVGAAVSGSFFPRDGLPAWVQTASLVTPNAWGIEIFSRLQGGQGLVDILPQLGGVVLLTLLMYVVALLGFRRQFD